MYHLEGMMEEERHLKRKACPEEIVNFDRAFRRCSLFTGVTEDASRCQISRKDRIYNTLVLLFLYSNLLRTTIQCFLPYGSPWISYLGDFKVWWGKPYIAHQVVFYMAVLVVPAVCTLNITADKSLKRWCLPFKLSQGLITGEEAKLWNASAVIKLKKKVKSNFRRAFFATFSVNWPYGLSVLVSYFIFFETWTQFILLGIPWTIYETLWSFYICSNMGLLPNSFDIVCYYLRLRYEQIDELLSELNQNYVNLWTNHSLLPLIRRQMNKLLQHLDETNKDVIDYNKYWSKYTSIVFMSYIPQLLFELYVFIFLPMNTSVLLFSLLLNLNIFALITQMAMFSAILHHKVRINTKFENYQGWSYKTIIKNTPSSIPRTLTIKIILIKFSYSRLIESILNWIRHWLKWTWLLNDQEFLKFKVWNRSSNCPCSSRDIRVIHLWVFMCSISS